MNFDKCKEEFDRYTSSFDKTIPKINRKYYHTYRVVELAEEIAKSENLNEHDLELAKICGLLHDIARFTQAIEYQTFNDYKSFDHGDKAYEILIKDDYISKYLDNEEDKQICLKAIKNHNKFVVENGLSKRELYFTNLLRDSDKLDILYTQKNLVDDGQTEIFKPVLEAFKEKRLYKIDPKVVTPNIVSEILLQMCFIYDFNFKKSYQIIKEKKIIENKIRVLRENCDKATVDEIEEIALNYINSKV